jgi:hypothetical protein
MKMGLADFYSSCDFLLSQRYQMANLTDGIDGLGRNFSHIYWL